MRVSEIMTRDVVAVPVRLIVVDSNKRLRLLGDTVRQITAA